LRSAFAKMLTESRFADEILFRGMIRDPRSGRSSPRYPDRSGLRALEYGYLLPPLFPPETGDLFRVRVRVFANYDLCFLGVRGKEVQPAPIRAPLYRNYLRGSNAFFEHPRDKSSDNGPVSPGPPGHGHGRALRLFSRIAPAGKFSGKFLKKIWRKFFARENFLKKNPTRLWEAGTFSQENFVEEFWRNFLAQEKFQRKSRRLVIDLQQYRFQPFC
jgi:hypothetical protein